MTITLEQLVYGKLVERAGGPVVPRSEYRITGASTGYPEGLRAKSHPGRLGLDTSDLFNWLEYPWNEAGGGFIVRGILHQGGPLIIAARIRGRPENGEGHPGRIYVQAHYAVAAVEQWTPAALALLPTVLNANPMMAEDRAMAQLQIGGREIQQWLDTPLKRGWLDGIAKPLEAVMSGTTYSLQDRQGSIDAFLDQCALFACAVPATLAWRLSFGAGLAKMKGDVSLALGQIAPATGLRVVNATLYGENTSDLTQGKQYVEWLGTHASGVETAGELVNRIAELLPQFAVPLAIAAELSPGETAQRISETVGKYVQSDALEAWLSGGHETRPDFHRLLSSREALRLVLGHLRPRGIEILAEFLAANSFDTLSQLAAGETDVGARAGMVARLAGHSAEPVRVDDVEFFASDRLPSRLVELIKRNLSQSLRNDRLDAEWARLVQDRFRGIAWLEQWFVESREDWFWLAAGHLETNDERLLSALHYGGGPLIDSFAALTSSGSIPDYEAASIALLDSAKARGKLSRLDVLFARLIGAGRVLAAAVFAEVCFRRRIRSDVMRILTDPDPVHDEQRVILARALVHELEASSQMPRGELMLGLLVGVSRPPDMGTMLASQVAVQLGDPLAEILIGRSAFGQVGMASGTSANIAHLAFRSNPRLVDALWVRLCRTSEGPAQQALLGLLEDKRLLSLPLTPTMLFLLQVAHGNFQELPEVEWTAAEVSLIKQLLKSKTSLLLQAIGKARSARQLLNGLSLVDSVSPVRPERAELIDELMQLRSKRGNGDLWPRLRKRLVEWRWHPAPVWRLLFLPWADLVLQDETSSSRFAAAYDDDNRDSALSPLGRWKSTIIPSPEEVRLFERLSYRHYLALAALGVRVAPLRLRQQGLPAYCTEARCFGHKALAGLMRFWHDANVPDFKESTVDILMSRVESSSTARQQLVDELSRGFLDRLRPGKSDVLSLVGAVVEALRLLPEEQRERKTFRILNE